LLFQTSLGIDIQDHAVSMVYLKGFFGGNGGRVAAHAAYPLKAFPSVEEKMEHIAVLIEGFLNNNRIPSTDIFLSIPRSMAILRYAELPSAVRENLKESIGYQMESYVPFSADDLYYDCQAETTSEEADKIRLLLVGVKKEDIDPYLFLGTRLNMRFSGIEARSTALANYFSNEPGGREEEALAFVCSDHGGLEVGILKSGFLAYSRRLEKREAGSDLPEQIERALSRVLEEFGDCEKPLKTNVVGEESDARWMDILGGVEGLDFHRPTVPKDGLSTSGLMAAYGAGLKGIMKVPMDINLVPDALRKRPSKVGRYMIFGLAAVLVLSLLAWGGGIIFYERSYVKRLNGEIQRLQVAVAETQKTESAIKQLEDRIRFLDSFFRSDTRALEVLKELTITIPKTAWVQTLVFSGGEVRIDGSANSSSELVSLLDASNLFEEVAFVSPISREASGKERFRLKLRVK
jgi:Tfp pilus assembly protein PilN